MNIIQTLIDTLQKKFEETTKKVQAVPQMVADVQKRFDNWKPANVQLPPAETHFDFTQPSIQQRFEGKILPYHKQLSNVQLNIPSVNPQIFDMSAINERFQQAQKYVNDLSKKMQTFKGYQAPAGTPELLKPNPLGNALLESTVQSWGKTLDRATDPTKLKKDYTTDPGWTALEDTSNVLDFLPFVEGSLKAIKPAVKLLDKAGDAKKILKTIDTVADEAKTVNKVGAKQKLADLLHYADDLLDKGFTPGEIDRIGYKQYKEIIEKNLQPERIRLAKQVAQGFFNDHADRVAANMPLWNRLQETWNNTFAQVKNAPKPFQRAFTEWVGRRNEARTIATQTAEKFKNIPVEISEQVIDYMENPSLKVSDDVKGAAENIRKTFDELFNYARREGLDINYLKNYVTHVWKNSAEEVQQVFSASKYFKFAKNRTVPTYLEGKALGLIPRYSHPSQIIGEYMKNIMSTRSNIEFVDQLKRTDLITRNYKPGVVRLEVPGMQKYFAAPKLADLIQKTFSPNSNETLLTLTGELSGFLQDFSLAGGLPRTPINAFTVAQAVKEFTAGRFLSPIKAMVRSMSDSTATKYFSERADIIRTMQRNGIPIRTTFDYEHFFQNAAIKETFAEELGTAWDKSFNAPTFERFLPALEVDFFENAFRSFIKKMPVRNAESLAAEATKKFYGIVNDQVLGRPKETADALKTFFFAPKYRESMINFWVNLFNPKDLIRPENFALRRFWIGSVLTLVAYDALNRAGNNGKHLWENPEGKKLTALVRVGDTTVGVPFLPSIATLPRMAVNMFDYLAHGDLAKAGLESRKSMSMLIKPLMDAFANENYFGQEIYTEGDAPTTKWKKILMYVGGQWNHPYIREGVAFLTGQKPLSQAISNALELPIRFYKTDSLAVSDFYDSMNKLETVAKEYKAKTGQDKISFAEQHQQDLVDYVAIKNLYAAYLDVKDAAGTDRAKKYLVEQQDKQKTSFVPEAKASFGYQEQTKNIDEQAELKTRAKALLKNGFGPEEITAVLKNAGANPATIPDIIAAAQYDVSSTKPSASTEAKRYLSQGVSEENVKKLLAQQGLDPEATFALLQKQLTTRQATVDKATPKIKSTIRSPKLPKLTIPKVTAMKRLSVTASKVPTMPKATKLAKAPTIRKLSMKMPKLKKFKTMSKLKTTLPKLKTTMPKLKGIA